MKDVDLIKLLRQKADYRLGYSFMTRQLFQEAADRLEELTKQPEVKPHPQQQWNIGRKNPEDYND